MLFIPVERLASWLHYESMMLDWASDYDTLTKQIELVKSELIELDSQLDRPEMAEPLEALNQKLKDAEKLQALLVRVKMFTGDDNPRVCTHVHKRRYTGVFFNSVEVIQCLSCQGWQSVRSVIL